MVDGEVFKGIPNVKVCDKAIDSIGLYNEREREAENEGGRGEEPE